MLLNSLELGLRYTGLANIQFQHFENDASTWVIKSGRIESLTQSVREKAEKQWTTYQLFFKDDTPKLCFLRHLLVLVHCQGEVHSKFLYSPLNACTEEHPENIGGTDLVGVEYSEWYSWLRHKAKEVCHVAKNCKWGPHTPRRTFYLFGLLGGASSQVELGSEARHCSTTMISQYWQDSYALVQSILNSEVSREHQVIYGFKSKKLVRGGGTMPGFTSLTSPLILV